MTILCIGAVLWDVFGKEEHIGGAPFNLAAHAAKLGHKVLFVSAVGDDDRGRRALERMKALGLDTRFVRRVANAPTGHVSVYVSDKGQPDYTIHRPAAYDFPSLSTDDRAEIARLRPKWICFGTLEQLGPQVRTLTKELISAHPQARRFYDINLRRDSWNADIVRELLAETSILKINDDEVRVVQNMLGDKADKAGAFCRTISKRFGLQGVCVTRGESGCAVWFDGAFVESPGYKVKVADTVGAGDAFAAAFLHGLASNRSIQKTADFANRLGALVASKRGAIPDWSMKELRALQLTDEARRAGAWMMRSTPGVVI